ncbi:MAG TPA: hypothetical protein DDY13_10025 [Cytophagales bacterium]|nr:hypothetical protein [Cytophagales bacterium]
MQHSKIILYQHFLNKIEKELGLKSTRIETKETGLLIEFDQIDKVLAFLFMISSEKMEASFIREGWLENAVDRINIWEDQWLQKPNIILSRLKAQIGTIDRVYARNTVIAQIDKKKFEVFVEENHLIGKARVKYKYGLFFEGKLIAVAGFSKGRNIGFDKNKIRSFEMVRFCNKSGTTVVGGLSKCLSHFIAEHQPEDIMTYVDKDWTEGNSFEQLGFLISDDTPPIEMWVKPDKFTGRTYRKRIENELNQSFSDETLYRNGYYKVYSAGNIKFNKTLVRSNN